MNILEIQNITSAQISEVVELERICLGGLWTAEGYQREIESPSSDLVALHLKSDETPRHVPLHNPNSRTTDKIVGLGCLWAIVNEAHITLLAIHPDCRRQGFGQLLLLKLLEDAISRNLEWATLEVNVNNAAAINLYQKFGFEIAGTRKGYYQATGEDALILWRQGIQMPDFRHSIAWWWQELIEHLGQNQLHLNIN